MADLGETIDQEWTKRERPGGLETPVPGVLLVFSATRPLLVPVALGEGPLEIGRGQVAGDFPLDDGCLSRRHAEVWREGTSWVVRDLGSRNGSALDGETFTGERRTERGALLRSGDSLFLLCADLRPYLGERVVTAGGVAIGPTLRRLWDDIDGAARSGETLHITGETGSGKELAARRFHESGPRGAGPFVAVNCATIPTAIAERLLFGARKGAYSGADADVEGYLQEAHGGTLLLDEVAELDLQVQAKLLRVLETREVLALGASRPRKLDLGVVSATHGDLPARVAEGRFREDLHFRLGRPRVALPPLRERREDLAFLIEQGLRAGGLATPHASLVEAALLRPWPGNIRELLLELREAVRVALGRGAERVMAEHLPPGAGLGRAAGEPATPAPLAAGRGVATPSAPRTPTRPAALPAPTGASSPAGDPGNERQPHPPPTRPIPDLETVGRILREHEGNISQAARALGAHRTQFKRWLLRYQLDPRAFLPPQAQAAATEAPTAAAAAPGDAGEDLPE